LEDLPTLERCKFQSRDELINFLKNKNIRFITYSQWKKLDKYEVEKGKLSGKIRKRICSREEIWKILDGLEI
jgi:hypothetical protein